MTAEGNAIPLALFETIAPRSPAKPKRRAEDADLIQLKTSRSSARVTLPPRSTHLVELYPDHPVHACSGHTAGPRLFHPLRFEVLHRHGNYAYIEREQVDFRLLEESPEDATPPGTRHFAYYIDVRDVDRLYAELKPKLDALPKGDVYGPVNQSYLQRELLILAPDGNLIAFGQTIGRP